MTWISPITSNRYFANRKWRACGPKPERPGCARNEPGGATRHSIRAFIPMLEANLRDGQKMKELIDDFHVQHFKNSLDVFDNVVAAEDDLELERWQKAFRTF